MNFLAQFFFSFSIFLCYWERTKTDFMSNELQTFLSNELRSREDIKYTMSTSFVAVGMKRNEYLLYVHLYLLTMFPFHFSQIICLIENRRKEMRLRSSGERVRSI